jgi:hypothetical protein
LNNDFWEQHETVRFTLKPSKKDIPIAYKTQAIIPKPPSGINDETSFEIEVIINEKKIELNSNNFTERYDNKNLYKDVKIDLKGQSEYKFLVKKRIVLSKTNNIDKRAYAICIQKNVKVTVVTGNGMDIEFYQTGTINKFDENPVEINGATKVWKWNYNGIILPKQGFIIIFKH